MAEYTKILEWLGISVFVFRDRVEIRGFIPTEVIDIPCVGNSTIRVLLSVRQGEGDAGG